MSNLIISIDGPSGSGKSTTARLVAERLGLVHIDTGAMYRTLTLRALAENIPLTDEAALGAMARELEILQVRRDDGSLSIFADGIEVTDEIRTPEISNAVSGVSQHADVRKAMVARQRLLARDGGVVLEGRDIGSVVLPAADVKIYLEASVAVRAERRFAELSAKGNAATLDEVTADIERRDQFDMSRKHSPLKRALGSWAIDSSALTIDEQVDQIVQLADRVGKSRSKLHEPRTDGQRPRVRRLVFRMAQAFLRGMARLLFGLKIHNPMDATLEENYIFTSNHKAYVDPPFIGSTFPREAYFIAKASLFRNPLFGGLIRFFNAFPIKRGVFDREAMAFSLDLMKEGQSMLIFIEGGRVEGPELGEARSGVGFLALQSGIPVVPVYARGTDRLMACLLRKTHLVVSHGRPVRIPPELRQDLLEGNEREAYRAYSEMIMAAIQGLKDEVDEDR